MDLIKELGLEKCKAIVDGAPELAESFNVYLAAHGSAGTPCKGDVLISDLRTAIADHGTLIYEGTIIGSKYSFENSITDHCTDIANHISPLTKVIEK